MDVNLLPNAQHFQTQAHNIPIPSALHQVLSLNFFFKINSTTIKFIFPQARVQGVSLDSNLSIRPHI